MEQRFFRQLEQTSEIRNSDKDGTRVAILNNELKKGKIHPKVAEYINMEELSKRYGWRPSEIRKERIEDLVAYEAIMRGEVKAEKFKMRNNGAIRSRNKGQG